MRNPYSPSLPRRVRNGGRDPSMQSVRVQLAPPLRVVHNSTAITLDSPAFVTSKSSSTARLLSNGTGLETEGVAGTSGRPISIRGVSSLGTGPVIGSGRGEGGRGTSASPTRFASASTTGGGTDLSRIVVLMPSWFLIIWNAGSFGSTGSGLTGSLTATGGIRIVVGSAFGAGTDGMTIVGTCGSGVLTGLIE